MKYKDFIELNNLILEDYINDNNNNKALDYQVVLDLEFNLSNVVTDIKIDHGTKQIIITNKEQEKKDND